MAGPLAIISTKQLAVVTEKPSPPRTGNTKSWPVSFSRYLTVPPHPAATCPSLVPLPNNRLSRPKPGVWISSRSPTASLCLRHDPSGSATGSVLSVVFEDTVLEEHYVSRLHFSWPQVSCVSGFPSRGTRAVIVTYKDSVDEIQKFALRFSKVSEVEAFINSLKCILNVQTGGEFPTGDFQAEMLLHSAFTASADGSPPGNDMEQLTPYSQLPLSCNYVTEQVSVTRETIPIPGHKHISPALPPNFTSLLTNCCSQETQDSKNHELVETEDLKSQIARYMEDSAFQDMLYKVEKVINEVGESMFQTSA